MAAGAISAEMVGDFFVAIPLAAGVPAAWWIFLTPALGAVVMSASTGIVAINEQLLKLERL